MIRKPKASVNSNKKAIDRIAGAAYDALCSAGHTGGMPPPDTIPMEIDGYDAVTFARYHLDRPFRSTAGKKRKKAK